MRIATSTVYDNQISQIDTLSAQQQQYGAEASSGKQLNVPSDNPMEIAQDLAVRASIAQENQGSSNIQNASAQLTTVDGALSSLTGIMQSARSIAVQAAGGLQTSAQLQALANQVDGLLQQAIGVANTKYAGQYVFAGTANPTAAPVTPTGQPISGVAFSGNVNGQTEQMYNGESVSTSVTLGQAFNYGAPDGSPDVFQTLIALRNSLTSATVTSQSSSRVNATNTAFAPATAINSGVLATPLAADANGNVDITITSGQAPSGVTVAIAQNATISGVLAAINAQTGATGVSASFDYRRQQLVLSSASGGFDVADAASAGAPSPGNFVEAFGLQSQANRQTDVSRQLADIDNATQSTLDARATLGASLQTLTALGTAAGSQVVNDTKVQSDIEDADIAKVISQFSQTQTALQAAYGTTTRLESKTLFDYLQ